MSVLEKICTKCKKSFPATSEYFYVNKKYKSGLQCWCKKCIIRQTVACYKKRKAAAYKKVTHKPWQKVKKERRFGKRKVWYERHAMASLRRYARKRRVTVVKFDEHSWFESQPRPLRCYLCGELIKEGQKLHIDHKIPLVRGGMHAPWNLGITHGRCNLMKHTKTPWEYMPDRFLPTLF